MTRENARVSVCVNCAGGMDLARALDAELAEPVARVGCMNTCARPLCLSVRQTGRAAYVFGDMRVDQAAQVALFLGLYDAAPGGVITDARPLGDLREQLIARLPA